MNLSIHQRVLEDTLRWTTELSSVYVAVTFFCTERQCVYMDHWLYAPEGDLWIWPRCCLINTVCLIVCSELHQTGIRSPSLHAERDSQTHFWLRCTSCSDATLPTSAFFFFFFPNMFTYVHWNTCTCSHIQILCTQSDQQTLTSWQENKSARFWISTHWSKALWLL